MGEKINNIDIKEEGDSIILNLSVKTNAKKNKIYRDIGGEIILEIKAVPIKGKANKIIIKFLKKQFGGYIEIVKGHKSHNKVIRIENANLNIYQIEKTLRK